MSGASEGRAGPSVAVVGGGLAGLAAAAVLAEQGLQVELFEARSRLGGRARSFRDPHSGELIDHCRHVLMGCSTNLADFCRRTGIARCFRRDRRLHFFGPDGARYDFRAACWLPAPLHLAPSLLGLGYLALSDRIGIARALLRLSRSGTGEPGNPATIGEWLRSQNQSERAIERFWAVVLQSALGETLDRASTTAARKVFVEGFLASRRAYELEIPLLPWEEILDGRVGAWLAGHRVVVHRSCRVRQIEGDARRAATLLLADGSRRGFDFFVLAAPWRSVRRLLSGAIVDAIPGLRGVGEIEAAPITAVHLWLDRPITPLPHAVLVGRLSQWLFREEENAGQAGPLIHRADTARLRALDHCQVVISGSHALRGRQRDEVLAEVQADLRAVFPAAREARLVRWRIVTEPEAVFSVRPGVDELRPSQQTPVANLALAGDWTATGWPATMESAVRSGYLAAEVILRTACTPRKILLPDLPRRRLARWILGPSET